jgi:hypothetical protein
MVTFPVYQLMELGEVDVHHHQLSKKSTLMGDLAMVAPYLPGRSQREVEARHADEDVEVVEAVSALGRTHSTTRYDGGNLEAAFREYVAVVAKAHDDATSATTAVEVAAADGEGASLRDLVVGDLRHFVSSIP